MALVISPRFRRELARGRAEHGPTGRSRPPRSRLPSRGRAAGLLASKGPDISLRFGLYPGERLLAPLDAAVERLVVRPCSTPTASAWRLRPRLGTRTRPAP